MTRYTLDEKLAHARTQLARAERDLKRAEKRREKARELGGGLLSFGGSGSQAAAGKVRSATTVALRESAAAEERVEVWRAKVNRFERLIAERDRIRFTRDDIVGATHVRTALGWHEVVRVNQTTVTVATPYSWNDKHPFSKVLEIRKASA